MTRKDAPSCRVQVYLNDPKIVAGLNREARTCRIPLSQAAGRAITRGLQRNEQSGDDHRLSHLQRSLQDHMKSTARDMQIVQELLIEVSRTLFQQTTKAADERDPMFQAAVDRRIERLLNATAARIMEGEQASGAGPQQDETFGATN